MTTRTADSPPVSRDIEAFYAANVRALTLQLWAYTGDLASAQDLVQEAFCRALPRWERIRRYDDPAAWVRRVAWNLATSRWRRARAAAEFLRRQRAEHVEGPTPDRVVLAAALAALPEQQRAAVVLHHLADLSVRDIAAQLGAAEGTVRVWLHRGRTALAAQLADEPEGHRG
ncbi:SigE family RNA polymerase sigma factor [Dactylosporangium sp. NPDC051541]|uniref:SigE family RNA polymerase sigma factor n=1 Tax=Dactylosporangium sp. NPDC051541 TaxID=3363977 RepID=UPI0037989D92